jgi:hypothetical protein
MAGRRCIPARKPATARLAAVRPWAVAVVLHPALKCVPVWGHEDVQAGVNWRRRRQRACGKAGRGQARKGVRARTVMRALAVRDEMRDSAQEFRRPERESVDCPGKGEISSLRTRKSLVILPIFLNGNYARGKERSHDTVMARTRVPARTAPDSAPEAAPASVIARGAAAPQRPSWPR